MLLGMSEKSRWPPSLAQTGPSDHLNPPASTSIRASLGMSSSSLGSLRSMLPRVVGRLSSANAARATATAATQAAARDTNRGGMGGAPGPAAGPVTEWGGAAGAPDNLAGRSAGTSGFAPERVGRPIRAGRD